jgi:tetratricopeptide (TPR) repeat protein
MRILLTVLALLVAAPPIAAEQLEPFPGLATSTEETSRYQRCVTAAEKNPAEGFEEAMAWRDGGGGHAARHCVAMALFYLGQPAAAAVRLEELAERARAVPPVLRARVLAQAGSLWRLSGDIERSHAALTTAIQAVPDQPDLYVDRATSLAAAKNYWEAIDDLNKAIDLEPRYGIAFAFRAAAYRFVDSLDLAADDAEQAVRLAPDLPEGWLERGILRRLRGDVAGARSDWLRVLTLDPDGAAGDAARANIERLEYRLEDKPAELPTRRTRWWNPF